MAKERRRRTPVRARYLRLRFVVDRGGDLPAIVRGPVAGFLPSPNSCFIAP